jgi:nitrogen fixation NifU-like protein
MAAPVPPGASLAAMYQERILAHYRAPQGRGLPTGPSVRVGSRRNPLCGDDIRVGVVVDRDRVVEVGFDGRGCSITTASASMLTGAVRGLTVPEVHVLTEAVERLLRGDPDVPEALTGDLHALGGVARYPQRVGCARMPWQALSDALAEAPAPGGAPADA